MEMLEHGDELEHETFEDHAENVALNDHLGHNEEDDLEEDDRHEVLDDWSIPLLISIYITK